jgi:CBS domain containing-hemolysin-like protein
MRQSGHSRFPFSPTGRADDISGVVLAKELLFAMYDHPELIPWQDVVRETLFVPETIQLNVLLQSFRNARKHIAVAVDEYGGTQGIVTLEDVLEELVGDIIDESDRLVQEISLQPDGSYQALATVEMRRLVSELGIQGDIDEDVVTLTGLLAGKLERVPVSGDVVEWNGYQFEVLSALGTRAEVVRVVRVQTPATKDSAVED